MNLENPFRSPSPSAFEVLYRPFVLFCRFSRIEGAQVSSLAGFGIYFARIEPVLAGLQFPNHRGIISGQC
jgi:hypothetical protein